MLKEFTEFISRGKVIDLGIAVVIGAAFAALVMPINHLKRRAEQRRRTEEPILEEAPSSTKIKLLAEVRDLLAKRDEVTP